MSLNIELSDSEQDIRVIEKESLFLKDFIDFWKVIRDHRTDRIDEIIQICKLLYDDYTKSFIDKWGDRIKDINTDTPYLEDYFSFEFTFPTGNTILVPHKILVFESLCRKEDTYHYLRRITNLQEFLFYFERTCKDLNLPLNKTDVQILQALSSSKFTGISEKIPTIEGLAKICNCDPQTYRRRIKRLQDVYIYDPIYLIDLAKLGYETFISISKDTDFSTQDYCLANVPYNVSINDHSSHRMMISQIPFFKPDIYHIFRNQSDTLFWQRLSHAFFGGNLSSLTPSVESRWRIMPPILSIMDWDDEIIASNSANGITLDLFPDADPYRLSSIEVKVLSLFEKYHELKNIEMARKAGISEKTVQKVWARISKMKLIQRFSFIRNLGFDVKPWISIIGHDPITQGPIIKRIIEHLKYFPFSWLFYDLGRIDMGVNPIIVGLVYLPSCWVKDFFVKFNLLSKYGFSTKIDISYDRSNKWNINLSKTYPEVI